MEEQRNEVLILRHVCRHWAKVEGLEVQVQKWIINADAHRTSGSLVEWKCFTLFLKMEHLQQR